MVNNPAKLEGGKKIHAHLISIAIEEILNSKQMETNVDKFSKISGYPIIYHMCTFIDDITSLQK